MASKIEKYDEILYNLFETLEDRMQDIPHENNIWFSDVVNSKPVFYCFNTKGQLLIFDSKSSLNIIDDMIKINLFDYSRIPDYISVGYGTIYQYHDLFNASRKKPGEYHRNLTINEYDLAIRVVKILIRIVINNIEDLSSEESDYMHSVNLEYLDDSKVISLDTYKKYPIKKSVYSAKRYMKNPKTVDLYKKTEKNDITVDVFELNIPVLFRKENVITTPFLVLYSNTKKGINSHLIFNCKYKELSSKILELILNEKKLPSQLQLPKFISSKIGKELSNLGIDVYDLFPEQLTFDMECNFQSIILEDNYDFLREHGYVDYDDIKEAYNKIDKMYEHFIKMTSGGNFDPMLIQLSDDEFTKTMDHYNSQAPIHYDEFVNSVFFKIMAKSFYNQRIDDTNKEFMAKKDLSVESFTEYLENIGEYLDDMSPEVMEQIKVTAKEFFEAKQKAELTGGMDEVFGTDEEYETECEEDFDDELTEEEDFETSLVS